MNQPNNTGGSRRDWLRAGFFFSLGAALLYALAQVTIQTSQAALEIIAPFVIGGVLALMLDPTVDKLEQRGLSRLVAAGLIFAVLLIVLVGLGFLIVPAIVSEAGSLATHVPAFIADIHSRIDSFLAHHHKVGSVTMPASFNALSARLSDWATALLQRSSGDIAGWVTGSVTAVIQTVLTLIVTFTLLADIDRLRARFLYLLPESSRPMALQVAGDVGDVFSDYVRGLATVCSLYAVAMTALLFALSIVHHELANYALLVGVAAGVLYAVPYVGSLTTMVVTFLVAFASATTARHSGAPFAVVAILLCIVVNQVFDNIVTPRVVGGGVGLHPVLAIFALSLGAVLFGVWGMLLSVPVAGSIQVVICRIFPHLGKPTPPEIKWPHRSAPVRRTDPGLERTITKEL